MRYECQNHHIGIIKAKRVDEIAQREYVNSVGRRGREIRGLESES